MIKIVLAAAAVSLAALSGASAAPMAPATQLGAAAATPVVQVQHRHMDRGHHGDHRGPARWVPGHRYSRAPAHWHRFHSRPRDWRTRGCILVGPLWFCP